jgi:hypothetical protein
MEGRQRLGAVLVVAGIGLVAIGGAGFVSGSGGATLPATTLATSAPTGAGPAPTTRASIAVTPSPTTPPTTEPTVDTLAIVIAFFDELERAVHDGAQETLADRLGEAVIDRYGADNCRAFLAAKEPFPEQGFEILGVRGPAPWDYVTDELTTTIPGATTVDANVTAPDATGAITTVRRDLHVQLVDGVVRWFTDCGEPLSAP